jgi:hypothetical protein
VLLTTKVKRNYEKYWQELKKREIEQVDSIKGFRYDFLKKFPGRLAFSGSTG